MWWKVITFCIIVCVVLFVVLSCIIGRPATHLLFHRCCEDGIENDEIIMENFRHNYLRERLIATEGVDAQLINLQDFSEVKVTVTVSDGKVKTVYDFSDKIDNIDVITEKKVIDDLNEEFEVINVHNLKARKKVLPKKSIDESMHELLEEFIPDRSNGSSGEEVIIKTGINEKVPSI